LISEKVENDNQKTEVKKEGKINRVYLLTREGMKVYLKNIEIENWKSIDKVKIEFENLMLFIGRSNHGKSSIFSAILFFLGERNFRKNDPRKADDPVRIRGVFEIQSVERIKALSKYLDRDDMLNLEVNVDRHGKTCYKVIKGNRMLEIDFKGYERITNEVEVLFIPSIATDSHELTEFFYKKLLRVLEREDTLKNVDVEEIMNIYSCLREEYASKGLQRNVIFNIARVLARDSLGVKKSVLGNTMILYEEPELYLHPQAERELYDSLVHLSKLGTQIYVCTHSGAFIGLKQYRSICIVRRDAKGTNVFQQRKKIFSRDEVKKFNMNYWINPDRSELFFAKRVILVEGQTDKILIPFLARILGVYKYDYSVIECGSKSTLPQYIKLLNKFCIPYVAVYDKDNHAWRPPLEKQNSLRRNKDIQRTINYEIGRYVEFENDIEEEIGGEKIKKSYKNKPYLALKKVMDKEYNIPEILVSKIKKIYS